MIQQAPKKRKEGDYHRTDAQRKPQDTSDLECGYDKSKINSGKINYPTAGNKI